MTTTGKNDHRFDDLLKKVGGLGGNAAKGADSLPQVALAVLRAAKDDVIDLSKDSKGVDAAMRIYTEYAKNASKTVFDHKHGSLKSQFSKLRAFIKAGRHPHGDPEGDMDRAIELRAKEFAIDEKSVRSPYDAQLEVARAIPKFDRTLTDDELLEAVRVAPPTDKTLAKVLAQIEKTMTGLVTGDKIPGTRLQTPGFIKALDLVTEERVLAESPRTVITNAADYDGETEDEDDADYDGDGNLKPGVDNPADTVAAAAGKALEQAYPFGYRSDDEAA